VQLHSAGSFEIGNAHSWNQVQLDRAWFVLLDSVNRRVAGIAAAKRAPSGMAEGPKQHVPRAIDRAGSRKQDFPRISTAIAVTEPSAAALCIRQPALWGRSVTAWFRPVARELRLERYDADNLGYA